MPDFCTCGAQLPPDSLFCHKCGKPQREIGPAAEATEATVPEAVPIPLPAPAPVVPLGFRNAVAMRTAFMVAIAAALLSWIPFVNAVLWLAAGFFAVYLYRRRTGVLLNVRAGLRIGWITGLLVYFIVAIFFGGFLVLFHLSGGAEVFQTQFRNAADPRMMEALKMLQNGPDVALLLMQLFVFITFLSMAGGAIGAKLTGGELPPRPRARE
jgi:hypothetical protein